MFFSSKPEYVFGRMKGAARYQGKLMPMSPPSMIILSERVDPLWFCSSGTSVCLKSFAVEWMLDLCLTSRKATELAFGMAVGAARVATSLHYLCRGGCLIGSLLCVL